MGQTIRIDGDFDRLLKQLHEDILKDTGLRLPDSELTRLVATAATFNKRKMLGQRGPPRKRELWDM